MEINKSGWVYKAVYSGTPPEKVPTETNLCQFFWEFVGACAWLTVACLSFAIGTVIAVLLFGYLPDMSDNDKTLRPIAWWPKFRGHHVMPLVVLLIIGLVTGAVQLLLWIALAAPKLNRGDWMFILVTAISILGVPGLFCVIPRVRQAISKTEVWQVFKAYLKARKEKFCPIITFVEK